MGSKVLCCGFSASSWPLLHPCSADGSQQTLPQSFAPQGLKHPKGFAGGKMREQLSLPAWGIWLFKMTLGGLRALLPQVQCEVMGQAA